LTWTERSKFEQMLARFGMVAPSGPESEQRLFFEKYTAPLCNMEVQAEITSSEKRLKLPAAAFSLSVEM
jgi:hypothetical protein